MRLDWSDKNLKGSTGGQRKQDAASILVKLSKPCPWSWWTVFRLLAVRGSGTSKTMLYEVTIH